MKHEQDKCAGDNGPPPPGSMWCGNEIARRAYRVCQHRRSSHGPKRGCAFCTCKAFVEEPKK